VLVARVLGRAFLGVLLGHRKNMLIDVPVVRAMQMPIMQVAGMAFMLNDLVPAARAMLMSMSFVGLMLFHGLSHFKVLLFYYS
jgi:hypothetical protein